MDLKKTLLISLDEYNGDVQKARSAGLSEGAQRIVNVVRDILRNKGANLDITADADPELVKFINEVKTAVGINVNP